MVFIAETHFQLIKLKEYYKEMVFPKSRLSSTHGLPSVIY